MYSGLYTPRTPQHALYNFTPVGLHVLVVDDDPLCLKVLDRMLRQCNYKVTTSNRVKHALELLREEDNGFDIVISDVYMPDEDGFKLLEVIGLELDLPVIMISANGDFSVVMKGIIHGACDYLIKPVRIEELQNIWQHVIRRKSKGFFKSELQGENDVDVQTSEAEKELYRKSEEVLEVEDFCAENSSSCSRKARVNWSVQLHHQFVNAVNQLGIEKAVPKKILEIMNVQGLSRENVASHLQKYRLYLKRLSGVIHEPLPVASFQASENGAPGGSMLIRTGKRSADLAASVKGRNLAAGLGSKTGKMKKVDPGTLKSLSQLKSLQQKQAANRAQVLSAIGAGDPSCSGSSSHGGLFRMASLDVSFLLQAKEEALSPVIPSSKVVDDLAMRSISRSVKLEDDVVFPGASPGHCVYDVRRQSAREGLFVHGSAIESSKEQSRMGSTIVDQRKLSLDISQEAMEYRGGDLTQSNSNQICSADYRFAYGTHASPYMPAFQADMRDSPMSELNNPDCGQDKLRPMEKATREVPMAVHLTTDDTDNSTKQSYEVSTSSMATEMSGETFSDCETLISELDIIPHIQQYIMQGSNSELLDVDDYLQLD